MKTAPAGGPVAEAARPQEQQAPPRDPAARVWVRMRELVMERHDRRRQASEAVGLGFGRLKVLLRVAREPATLSALAERLLIDRPYVTVIVDELERRGFVTRTQHTRDRRCKIVALTVEGRAAVATVEAILGEPPPELRALPAADLAELDRILAAVDGR